MKPVIAFILFCFTHVATAQSPFNYGQTKKVCFISTAFRVKLSIRDIYTVDQRPDDDTGGMGENWDVTQISFSEENIADNWFPVSKKKSFKYSLSSLIKNEIPLNGL